MDVFEVMKVNQVELIVFFGLLVISKHSIGT